MSALRKFHIPALGGVFALLAFFLPWISVGCQNVFTIDTSGYELARGTYWESLVEQLNVLDMADDLAFEMGLNPSDLATVPEDTFGALDLLPFLWVVPAVAVIALLLVAVTHTNRARENQTALGHILLGLLGLGVLFYIWFQFRSANEELIADSGMEALFGQLVNFEYGLWIALAGLVLIAAGGLLSYLEARQGGGQLADYGGYTYAEPAPMPNYPAVGGTTMAATTDLAGGRATDFPEIAPLTAPGTVVGGGPSPHRPTEVINRPPEALAWLVMREGPRAGHTFRVSENTNIGRDAGNDIIIDDTSLSGQHAKIKLEDGNHFMLYDLASTNGVFTYDAAKSDWERVYRVELSDGQQIKLGRTVLSFMHLSPDKAAKA